MTTVCEIHGGGRQLVRLAPQNDAENGVLSEMTKRSMKGERVAIRAGSDGEYVLEVVENGA